jgi:fructose-specific phosphotransferase system IIC component
MVTFNSAVTNLGKFLLNMQSGLQAFTTQSYTEVNSKLGVQFESSFYIPSLAGGGTYDIVVTTGTVPLAIKAMSLAFDTELSSTQWFKNPAYTGGTSVPIYNYREGANSTPLVSIVGATTTTSTGTPVSSKAYAIGSSSNGNRHVSSVMPTLGVERILEANSVYLFRVINEDTVVMKASGRISWYEGNLDYNP